MAKIIINKWQKRRLDLVKKNKGISASKVCRMLDELFRSSMKGLKELEKLKLISSIKIGSIRQYYYGKRNKKIEDKFIDLYLKSKVEYGIIKIKENLNIQRGRKPSKKELNKFREMGEGVEI